MLTREKIIPSPRDIYIGSNKFTKLCQAAHEVVSNSILELYEQHGLLYPVFRLVRPKEYLQALFEQNHGPKRNSSVIEIPDEYVPLYDFENKDLQLWQHTEFPGFDLTLKNGHPLEQAYNRGDKFIEKPSENNVRNWSEYQAQLEYDLEGQVIRSTKSLVEHYYAPWQIYLLAEANYRYTYRINSLQQLKEGEKYVFPAQQSTLTLAKWADHFTVLWQYRFRENLAFEKALKSMGSNILEGDALMIFNDHCADLARQFCTKYTYEQWIAFLKALCGLYFKYDENERVGLSECVKSDIRSSVDLIMRGIGQNYKTIIQDVGSIMGGRTYFHIPPLEMIYPEYESHVKREATWLLQSGLERYNSHVSDNLKLSEAAVPEIINHAFKIGNETLLVSIISVNQEYFEPSFFDSEGLWSHIRSLSSAVESWSKDLAGKNDFAPALDALTNGDFNFCCDQLSSKCGRKNIRVQNFVDLRQLLETLATLNLQRDNTPLPWMKFVIKAYLIRNYAIHHTKLEPELFGSAFVEIWNSFLFLVCFVWRVHS